MYKLIKHRGLSTKDIKENTYDAIKRAIESQKYMGVEFDVRETLDHEFIIYHDPLFNGNLISKTLYQELPKYIPRLIDILKIKSSKIFLIEIKNIESIIKFIKIINKFNYKKIYVMSFISKYINKIDIKTRKYKIGILNYVLNTSKDNLKLDFICILNSLINNKTFTLFKDMEIFSYGIKEKLKYENVYYIVDK